jgi:hypothetical protein
MQRIANQLRNVTQSIDDLAPRHRIRVPSNGTMMQRSERF